MEGPTDRGQNAYTHRKMEEALTDVRYTTWQLQLKHADAQEQPAPPRPSSCRLGADGSKTPLLAPR